MTVNQNQQFEDLELSKIKAHQTNILRFNTGVVTQDEYLTAKRQINSRYNEQVHRLKSKIIRS